MALETQWKPFESICYWSCDFTIGECYPLITKYTCMQNSKVADSSFGDSYITKQDVMLIVTQLDLLAAITMGKKHFMLGPN